MIRKTDWGHLESGLQLSCSKINSVISIFDFNLNISQSEITPRAPTNITTLHGQFEC